VEILGEQADSHQFQLCVRVLALSTKKCRNEKRQGAVEQGSGCSLSIVAIAPKYYKKHGNTGQTSGNRPPHYDNNKTTNGNKKYKKPQRAD